MLCLQKNPAQRQYYRRVMFAMALYVTAILGVSWIFKHHHPQGALIYLLALLPALPIFAVIASFGIYLAELTDEFQRRVVAEGSLWATGVVLTFSTFWGFLQNYAFTSINLPVYWVFIVWWFSFGVAEPLVRRRYK